MLLRNQVHHKDHLHIRQLTFSMTATLEEFVHRDYRRNMLLVTMASNMKKE